MKDVAIVIPSLDPDEVLITLVKEIQQEGYNSIVVVNDGSAEEKQGIFDALSKLGVTVLTHDENMGKGSAIKTGLRWLKQNRSEIAGAVTADGDGQHKAHDIITVAQEVAKGNDGIVLGSRKMTGKGIPFRSKIGNLATRMALKIATGKRLKDSQTGLRGLPLARFEEFCELEGERYEFEMNALVYAGKNNIPIIEVPIQTVYINGNVGSKFRVVADTIRVYRAFAYTLNSIISTLIELIVFTVANWLLDMTGVPTSVKILIATITGRICDSIVNYTINKKTVFGSTSKQSLRRYYTIWLCQMGSSYGLVYLLVKLTGAYGLYKTLIKMCVDIGLFFVGYYFQKNWVFADVKDNCKNAIQNGGKTK